MKTRLTKRLAACALIAGVGIMLCAFTGCKGFYVQCVRGNTNYGINTFADNGDGTVTDSATGLVWTQSDSGSGMNWEEALAWAQTKNTENYLGHNDWRLPNVKELQSIVDYTRSPDTTSSAAINAVFTCTQITNEAGQADYPWYWSGTTHAKYNVSGGASAACVCFGRAMAYMNGAWSDVHGAGCQRSDPKDGSPSSFTYAPDGYYNSIAPQGDAIRINNYVRLVRDMAGIEGSYPIVDTGQTKCYNASAEITAPLLDQPFYGQDSQQQGNQPSYTLSSDGKTVLDNVTKLTWMRGPNTTLAVPVTSDKKTYSGAQSWVAELNAMNYGGFSDWRLPTIKELYSLINFNGTDPRVEDTDTSGLTPFIDTNYFNFAYGDTNAGERIIDSQYASSTLYAADSGKMFGVNFADGRIKGY